MGTPAHLTAPRHFVLWFFSSPAQIGCGQLSEVFGSANYSDDVNFEQCELCGERVPIHLMNLEGLLVMACGPCDLDRQKPSTQQLPVGLVWGSEPRIGSPRDPSEDHLIGDGLVRGEPIIDLWGGK